MKNLIYIVFFSLLTLACSTKEEVKPEYAINYPEKVNSGEKRMIEQIMDKPSKQAKDYIQLAIIYGKYEKPSEEITYWLNKAWEKDPEKTKAVLTDLLGRAKDWDLFDRYSKEVESIIEKENK